MTERKATPANKRKSVSQQKKVDSEADESLKLLLGLPLNFPPLVLKKAAATPKVGSLHLYESLLFKLCSNASIYYKGNKLVPPVITPPLSPMVGDTQEDEDVPVISSNTGTEEDDIITTHHISLYGLCWKCGPQGCKSGAQNC